MGSSQIGVNFENGDNPMHDWMGKESEIPDLYADTNSDDTPEESTMEGASFHDFTFESSEENNTGTATDGDPYEVPAIQRRRRNRFFE